MGLRTASVRRRSQLVMAPALTETNTQTQNFKLAPKELRYHQQANPINSYRGTKQGFEDDDDEKKPIIHYDNTKTNKSNYIDNVNQASDILERSMNESSMGDQVNVQQDDDKMGLQVQINTNINMLQQQQQQQNKPNNKNFNDVEQLFGTEIPTGETNVDDLMQVITSMEHTEDFPISNDLARDLATSLLSFEKQLLNDVDMMNISMEDQSDCCAVKESQSNELIMEAQKKQVEVQRRLDFLKRRVLKLQTRVMGQHVGGEMAGVFEHVHRSLKRLKEATVVHETLTDASYHGSSVGLKAMTPQSAKTLVRKLESSTVIQANSAARQKQVPKYFGSGSIEPATFRTSASGLVVIPPWSTEHKQELQKVAGCLRSELRIVQSEVDSEATDSSSGGESCDEFQNYNNQHQQYLSIQKRALWKYSVDRAAVAARWTWLQMQISDLEYRIRQHSELYRQIRASKGAVTLGGADPPAALNGYRGQLPGAPDVVVTTTTKNEDDDDDNVDEASTYVCARTRPLVNFRKRKLMQTGGLHVISKKAARPSTVRCGCAALDVHCALCTGRADPTHPRDPPEVLSAAEKVALLDPGFHPVFSMSDDVSETIHLEAIMKMPEWQQRSARMKGLKGNAKGDRLDKTLLDHRSKKLEHRKKYGRLLKPSTISALSAKIKNKIRGRKANRHLNRLNRKRLSYRSSYPHSSNDVLDDEEVESISNNGNVARSECDSPSTSPLLQMQTINSRKNRISSYDIDNIVIPYSVAASTRVEKLQYKEILTPKWRIADDVCLKYEYKNNGVIKEPNEESDIEDLTEEATIARHDKCELDERKKFLGYVRLPIGYGRARSHKRTDSRAESSDTNTPDPMSPHPAENPDKEGGAGAATTATRAPSPCSPPLVNSNASDDTSQQLSSLPSISVLRRRTLSRTGFADETRCNTPDHPEVQPFDRRCFPLDDNTYDDMVRNMPEDHQQMRTNIYAQDTHYDDDGTSGFMDSKPESPGSESTESALADEDPNDPEWIDVERMSRDRHKR